MRPTTIYSLSAELGANTIDPYELNCRVRNGNGWGLVGIIISLIPASCKRTNFKRNLFYDLFLSALESFSPVLTGHRLLPTSDNLEKHKCFGYTHFNLSGLKNMAKPHDLLVQIS